MAAVAGSYDALCGGVGCTINVSANGISGPGVSIPSTRVTNWSMGGSSHTDVTTGVVTTLVFGLPGLVGFAAKNHDYSFSVSGYDEDGRKASLSFRFINDKPAKRLASALPGYVGLGMHQRRSLDEIVALEKGESESQLALNGNKPEQQQTLSTLKAPSNVLGRQQLTAASALGRYNGATPPASTVNSELDDWDTDASDYTLD